MDKITFPVHNSGEVIFLIRKRQDSGIIAVAIFFLIAFIIIIGRYFVLAADNVHAETASERMELTVEVAKAEGMIYDRNMLSLVGNEYEYKAVAIPQLLDKRETSLYAADIQEFNSLYDEGKPFVFECKSYTEDSDGLTVFRIPIRYSKNQLAQHVIGYTSQEGGIDGIEYAYDRILRGDYGVSSVTYMVDGFGRVLVGEGKKSVQNTSEGVGVVLTLDAKIQEICEKAGSDIEKGAIAVADVKTGDILALASFPDYSVYNLESALTDERSPMINRALYSYNVGSVFKLVTACEGINKEYEEFKYNCNGFVNIMGQNFNCHKLDGHSHQTMKDAIVNSCNTYFINLSSNFDVESFRSLCFNLGFGREIHLCSGMTASAGVLPSVEELMIPAELANFSFGQGKLTASPLQIIQLTCAIANDGVMPVLRIIKGITADGQNIGDEKSSQLAYAIEKETALKLQEMMVAAVEENEESNAKPEYTIAGAKTSTAQTGQFNDAGDEILNAWITGFFPADNPKYAVTVLIEDGGFGNDSAAPVFREIADKIVKYEEKD